MRYFKSIAIIVPLVAIGISQAAAASESKKDEEVSCSQYLVVASRLNVREKPGLMSNITDGLLKGKSVCVFSFSGQWAKIDKGWISSKYIVADREADKAAEVIEAEKETVSPDLNGTQDEVIEETEDPATNKEQKEDEAQAEPLEPEISPSLSQDENISEKKNPEETADTKEESEEPEKVEETEETKEPAEADAEAAEAKKTEELAVEKEDKTTADYLKQIRTQKGVRGTSYIYMLEGNGDKCEIMVLEKNSILVNTCKPAINKSGDKMLCTWNKKMCKTETQILKDIKK